MNNLSIYFNKKKGLCKVKFCHNLYIIRALAAKFNYITSNIFNSSLIASWSSPISTEVNVGYSLTSNRRINRTRKGALNCLI